MSASRKPTSPFYTVLFVILGVAFFVFVLLPGVDRDQPAMRFHSERNIYWIIQGLMRQSDSMNGRFPESAENWQQNLIDGNYAAADLFINPRADGRGEEYFFSREEATIWTQPASSSTKTLSLTSEAR